MFVNTRQRFTLFRLRKTAVPVEKSRYRFCVFVCACPFVICFQFLIRVFTFLSLNLWFSYFGTFLSTWSVWRSLHFSVFPLSFPIFCVISESIYALYLIIYFIITATSSLHFMISNKYLRIWWRTNQPSNSEILAWKKITKNFLLNFSPTLPYSV